MSISTDHWDAIRLTARNATELDLELDDWAVDSGGLALPLRPALPAGATAVFRAWATRAGAVATGHVEWSGAHPERGEFSFRIGWDASRGAMTASASHQHRIPWPAAAASDGVRTPTDFLECAVAAGCGDAGAELAYELHPRGGMRRPGSLVRRVAAVAMTAGALAVPGAASAQSPTVGFEGSYRAYNAWDEWKWWLPDKCNQTQRFVGSEPAAAGRYPVLVYTHGSLADWVGNGEGRAVIAAAAAEGFVAVAPSYDSWMATSATGVEGNAKCVYSGGTSGGALAQVCARPKADCSKGIVAMGFSLGGAVAGRAGNVADVKGAWLLGVSGPEVREALAPPAGTRALPDGRLRIAVGRADVEVREPDTGRVTGIDVSALDAMTGQTCSATRCLRSDGSGYYVVDHSEVADGVADHCFWMDATPQTPANSCSNTPQLDPGFRPPATAPWSLVSGLRWLRSKLA